MKTLEELVEKLDFNVERQKLITESGLDTGREAIVRADRNAVLGVVTRRYNIVSHLQALEAVHEKITTLNKGVLTKGVVTRDGARMYAEYTFPNERFEIQKGDLVNPTLTLVNSYDGMLKLGFIIGAYRLICSNGLRTSVNIVSIQRKHVASLELEDIIKSVQVAFQTFVNQILPRWKHLNESSCDMNLTMKELMPVLGKRFIGNMDMHFNETVNEWPERRTNWWLYNEFTAYLTHEYKPRSVEDLENKHKVIATYFERKAA